MESKARKQNQFRSSKSAISAQGREFYPRLTVKRVQVPQKLLLSRDARQVSQLRAFSSLIVLKTFVRAKLHLETSGFLLCI